MGYVNTLAKVISICLLVFFARFAYSQDKQEVTWYMYDLPPYHILRGEHQQQGPLDYLYQQWRAWLPQYQHRAISVNTNRMVREFQSKKDHRCVTGSFIFPESEGNWVWSKALYVEPPAVVVMRQETAKQYQHLEAVDFEQLIKDKSLIFGHFEGRIYSGEIDALINEHLKGDNVLSIGTYAPGESLMRMLQRGRVDYILEYLPEIHWLKLSNQLENNMDFTPMNIKAHKALSPVYMGCADTEWGRATVEGFNQKIDDKVRETIWQKYEKWLYSDFGIQRFRQAQHRYFLSDNK